MASLDAADPLAMEREARSGLAYDPPRMGGLPARAVDDDPQVRDAVGRWLGDRLDQNVAVVGLGRPRSGYSAETVVVDASVGGGERRFVLRKGTPDPPIYPQQGSVATEVEIQFRVMDALSSSSDVPVAPLVGYEGDEAVLGAPFFVMGHVEGEVPIEQPPYPTAGFFAEAAPDQRRDLIRSAIDVLGAVHRVDWRSAGLDWLAPVDDAPGTAQQVRIWAAYAEHELRGRRFPELTTPSPGSPPRCRATSRSASAGATGGPAT